MVKGSTGKVLQEVTTDGSVYYGTQNQPGDTNETAQFATDNHVRDDNYQFIIDGLHYLTCDLDVNEDGWSEGEGMIEELGMGAEKLDVAVYTIRALNDLAEMASTKNDEATQK
jgi:hypothetical protein